MRKGLTQALGEFVSGLRVGDLPREALSVVRTGFTDCVAAMIAGSMEPAPQLLKRVVAPRARGEARLYFSRERASAPDAAWINGTAAHALDYDDVALRGHPSAAIVPAILAEGEALGCSGAQLVAAYAAGYEVWAELVARERGKHHDKGWHPTGIFGPIAAAAGCANLLQLDSQKATSALAIAASQACGLMSNFGTMTKPFHAGRAAHSGLMAARLAAAGMSGSMDAIEHPQGFLSAVSPAGEFDAASPPSGLGKAWQIARQGLSVKKYPICFAAHRAVDAVLDLTARVPVRPAEVDAVVVSLSKLAAKLLRNPLPATDLAAKFSIQFAIASALVAGRVGLQELTDAFVTRRDVQDLMERITVQTNEDYDPEQPTLSKADWVQIRLRDGTMLETERVRRPRGHPSHPLGEGEMWLKFRDCVEPRLSARRTKVLFEALQSLETVARAQDLYQTPAARTSSRRRAV